MQAVCERTGHSLLDAKHEELSRAFASFTQAAGSLERSYGQLEEEVARLRRELEEANRDLARSQALAEMAALLAHEIRNPLGSLELFAGLLADGGGTSEERAEWVAQLQAGLRTLSATVNNVLHFHSQPAPALAECDLGEVLDRSCEFVRPLGTQGGVRIEIANGLHGVKREADPHRLQQVLLNLTLNALRFTAGGGCIRLAGDIVQNNKQRAAEIQVSDTGMGIAREHVGKIFERGFTTRAGSPGLGLAVCKKIVEQHRGTITVSSELGQGTTFTLSLPLP